MKEELQLPALVFFRYYSSNWEKYIEAVYDYFKEDFIINKPEFKNLRVNINNQKKIKGKEAGFWHLISKGKEEDNRLPDFPRCERIRWPKPLIEKYKNKKIKYWVTLRKREKRICLWYEEEDYIVILTKKKKFVMLITAYLVTYAHTKRKLLKEYEKYKKQKPPF